MLKPAKKWNALDGSMGSWHGFQRHWFEFQGRRAWIVEPREALPGMPFLWSMIFAGLFEDHNGAEIMVEKGFHYVHLEMEDPLGSPSALRLLHDFHLHLMERGFSKQAILIGIGTSGMMSHRYAVEYPEFVRLIYGDAPVLDIKSLREGVPGGKRNQEVWDEVKRVFGFATDADALAFSGNPIDNLQTLAEHNIPILYVISEDDKVVLPKYNAELAIERYRKLGGTVHGVRKPGADHITHGLEDPAPIVAFMLQHSPEVQRVPRTQSDSK
jgi:pimeloyl-ACP methyl ester carboxylesterase